MTDEPMTFTLRHHGLFYVTRDRTAMYILDGDAPGRIPMPRPELDVALALARWTVRRLEQDLEAQP